MNLPTGKYAGRSEATWQRILDAARSIPHLKGLAANYDRTGHPAILNAIMDNAIGAGSGTLWLIFYTRATP